ncbi:HlyD family type I secretion periplasmic adaptor subunit [Legionella hackeliae]|uniref:Membrane fusion protein (MFP) family protein n=1 Tax=Legionella hackeliae TaxID=449 RepID=A0A0A8US20_LEGHA|nr:HlyD family type I secretion periplasmic adaptor subunit [Legionella hackeliae]KTD08894.1 secretion system protein D [Legionella hackeliae]CEK10326.1 Type I secretion membrane fusion protein, HlyD [Legionella hackeliae]STX47055.1 HlyD family secretion protein [Legionella hackeliae]
MDELFKKLPPTTDKPVIRNAIIAGSTLLIVFVGGFFLWSLLFPLDSAAVAEGKFVVQFEHKTVQHMEGGIIEKIFINEGSVVKANTPLIKLQDTQAKTSLQLLQVQMWEGLAAEARIYSELNNDPKVVFPNELLKQKNNPDVQKIINGQERLFTAGVNTYEGQTKVLNQRIDQLHKEISSLQAQVQSETEQIKLIDEEIEAVAYLEAKKLIDRPRLLALKREEARLNGNRGEHLGLIAKAHQAIGETKSQMYTLMETRRKDLLEELRTTQQKLADVLEKSKAAEDVLRRTLIVAPSAGTVIGLKKHTVGGVITPGQEVLDIIPSGDQLIIEAEINPIDINIVRPGLKAKVHLTAYKQRNTPTLEGTVLSISADIFEDEATKKKFYKARITLDKNELARFPQIQLYPGMPVQVMIITEKRTAFDYLITPLEDSFRQAFHEE